jgi:hypothetical protein
MYQRHEPAAAAQEAQKGKPGRPDPAKGNRRPGRNLTFPVPRLPEPVRARRDPGRQFGERTGVARSRRPARRSSCCLAAALPLSCRSPSTPAARWSPASPRRPCSADRAQCPPVGQALVWSGTPFTADPAALRAGPISPAPGGAVPSIYSSFFTEARVAYLVVGMIVVIGGAIVLGALHVRHESSPGSRPSLIAARRVVRQARMASGGLCVCGGTLQATEEVSERFGSLLGCTGCRRSWTEDGRHVVRRRKIRRPRPGVS